MNKIIELFGHSIESYRNNWNDIVNLQQCIFLGKKCYKVRKSDPTVSIGSCTVVHGSQREPIIICPTRFIEHNQIFVDCLHLLTLHEPGNELHIIPEVSIPGGSVDYILVSIRDGQIRDFVGIEIQSVDTTGTIWPERQHLLKSLGVSIQHESEIISKPSGLNWKMSAKTIMMQIHHKISTFEHINKKLVLVIQNAFLDYIRNEFDFLHVNTNPLIGDSMHFHAYEVRKNHDNLLRIGLESRLSTDALGVAKSLGLNADAKIELEEIIKLLKKKISTSTILRVF